ncbi:MAG TPA: adaptor protein MecA [Eubacteriaceae bacterium]|nr:adaptor protein MecA [Eubacteriaceae bacterium]
MKVEKIHDKKIIVYISFTDLKERNIDKNEFHPQNSKIQSLFLDILEEAYVQEGFDSEGYQLYVEAKPLLNDGFKICITKFEDEEEFEYDNSLGYVISEIDELFYKTEYEIKPNNELLFKFPSLEIIKPCIRLLKQFSFKETCLYSLNKNYILTLLLSNYNKDIISNIIAILSEYGEQEYYSIAYINEHGEKMLYKNALKLLEDYFNL